MLGDGPDKAGQFADNRGRDDIGRLAAASELQASKTWQFWWFCDLMNRVRIGGCECGSD
jgi:hypothetical protein